MFQKFQNEIVMELQNRADENTSIQVMEIRKCNSVIRKGVRIERAGEAGCIIVYLEDFYEQYERGMEIPEIASEILRISGEVPVQDYTDINLLYFAEVMDSIIIKLVNTEKNLDMLRTVPHAPYEDLSIIYYYLVSINKNGIATVQITNQNLSDWGIDADTLHYCAMANSRKLFPASLRTIEQCIASLFVSTPDGEGGFPVSDSCDDELCGEAFRMDPNEPEGCGLYVLANSSEFWGASAICHEKVLEAAADSLGEDYYILPSSIHEVLLMPLSRSLSMPVPGEPAEALNSIVQEVNQTVVNLEEYLSDHVYYYDRSQKRLYSCA